MIVLNDTLGAFGGSHTMFVRMCEWYYAHNEKVAFLCDSRDNIEISMRLEDLGVKIYVINTEDLKATYKLMKLLNDGNLRVLNFWWTRYLNIEAMKYKYKWDVENVIYCIHPKTFIRGENNSHKNPLVRSTLKWLTSILEKMCKNNSIIMQDEIDIEETEKYYGIRLDPIPSIVRLPMKVEAVDKDVVIKAGFESKSIMTATRADFPFKGYVIGLVDDFVKLKDKFTKIKLSIACDGDDVAMLDKKIAGVPDNIRKDIKRYNWMSYEEIKKMMEHCTVYIGMGSSVLDSSLRYKPSIVSQFFTYDNIAKDFTVDNPYDIECKKNVKTSACKLIEEVLSLDFAEYKELCEKSFTIIKAVYDIDVIMDQLMKHKVYNKACILSRKEYMLTVFLNWLGSIRNRNTMAKSSFKNLDGGNVLLHV